MTDRRPDDDLGHLARRIERHEVPDGRGLASIRASARRRTTRRRSLQLVTAAAVLVVAVVGAGTLRTPDPVLDTAAPPGYDTERFDRIPDGIGTWEWRASDAIRTRTGKPTGYGFRSVTGSADLVIHLTDGGVCVDSASCAASLTDYDAADFETEFVNNDGGPIRSLVSAESPFAGWNVAVVPGVTGDFHAGDKRGVDVPGGPTGQQFVGSRNLDVVLEQLAAVNGLQPERVVLVGSGSAGLGALIVAPQIHDAFGDSLVAVIADGGAIPPRSGVLPGCVVQRWASLGDLAYPADWADVVDQQPNNLSGIYAYAAATLPDVTLVQLTTREDEGMRSLLRAGADACESTPPPIPARSFSAGIVELGRHLEPLAAWTMVATDGDASSSLAASEDLAELDDLDALLRAVADATP